MADNPITVSLPQDLPTNWSSGQTIGPDGTDVGLTAQHGYNYLMRQVNAAQKAACEVGEAFPALTAASVGAEPSGAAEAAVSQHNASGAAHSDIRDAIAQAQSASLPLSGGTMTGPINMNGQAISNLPAPSEDADPVRKTDVYLKSEQLSEATKELYGLSSGAAPDEVLRVLSKSAIVKQVPQFTPVQYHLAEMNEGDTFPVFINGVQFNFYIVQKNYQQGLNPSGVTAICGNEPVSERVVAWNTEQSNDYKTSALDQLLNDTYYNKLGGDLKEQIVDTVFPSSGGTADPSVSNITRKVFAPSGTELGFAESYFPVEGAAFPFVPPYIDALWLRSPYIQGTAQWAIYWYGDSRLGSNDVVSLNSAKPFFMFCLPNDATITYYQDAQGTLYPEQKYVNTMVFPNGDDIPLSGVEIVTYKGTGTYGEDNPCSVTFRTAPTYMRIVGFITPSHYDGSASSGGALSPGNNTRYETFPVYLQETYGGTLSLGYNDSRIKASADKKTITWYNPNTALNQVNESNRVYIVLGIH